MMDIFDTLTDKLSEYLIIRKKQVMTGSLPVSDFDLNVLYDCMASIGTVMERNEPEQLLVTIVRAGTGKNNTAYIVTKLEGSNTVHAAAYAKEGLISMHTAEKACEKMEDALRRCSL